MIPRPSETNKTHAQHACRNLAQHSVEGCRECTCKAIRRTRVNCSQERCIMTCLSRRKQVGLYQKCAGIEYPQEIGPLDCNNSQSPFIQPLRVLNCGGVCLCVDSSQPGLSFCAVSYNPTVLPPSASLVWHAGVP
jgi:hypothetical protein